MLMDLHMHSKYSDGKNTPEEMIEAGLKLGYEAMAITDHVWKTSTWVPEYAKHLEGLKKKYSQNIILYSGIEAKVLNLEGDIDAEHSFDSMVDLILGSIHRIPKSDGFYSTSDISHISAKRITEHWLMAFTQLLLNPRIDIIAHPLSELKGFGIQTIHLPIQEISELIAKSGKILEINVRYNSPNEPIVKYSMKKGVPIIISSDSHSVEDLVKLSHEIKNISKRGFQIIDIKRYVHNKKSNRTRTLSDETFE